MANITSNNNNTNSISIPDQFDETLIKRLLHLIVEDGGYKKHGLTLDSLAMEFNVNRTYLSRAINRLCDRGFVRWINELRVKEAMRLLSDSQHDYLTIEQIAEEVGFNNRNSFYNFFKSITGVSPATYRKNISNHKKNL